MNRNERRNQWRETIERCLSSGMTIRRWCELNSVAVSTFYAWMAKFWKEETALFPECNASEWIEITKEGLAASVALAPVKADCMSLPTQTKADRSTGMATNIPVTAPTIRTQVNGIEMLISAGSTEEDITAVFKAAMSL